MLPAWNLTDLYKDKTDPQIELDLKNLSVKAQQFSHEYSEKISQLGGIKLANIINQYENIYEEVGKLATF